MFAVKFPRGDVVLEFGEGAAETLTVSLVREESGIKLWNFVRAVEH